MLPVETFLELIERVEKAMRPLSASQQSKDQDRVRELYLHMLQEAADDPLEQARLSALHEILQPYLTHLRQTTVQDTSAVVYNVKAAIGALVMLLCRLDDRDYEAADASLSSASQVLQDVQELLKSLKGDVAHA
jgi:formiminotetrahydrofolate cyclodeaminase